MPNNETFADEPVPSTLPPPNIDPEKMAQLMAQAKYALELAIYTHSEIYSAMMRIRPYELQFTQEQCVDLCMYWREVEKYLKDMEKESRWQKEYLEKIVCIRWAQDPDCTGEPIRTDICTASPDIKTGAAIPTFAKEPEQYAALMDYLGIDPVLRDQGKFLTELGAEETACVKVNWNGFVALLTRLKAGGYPMPDGIDPAKTYQIPRLKIRRKKGVVLTDSTSIKELSNETDE